MVSDREILEFLFDRLVRHGDSPNLDFMIRFRQIIKATPVERNTKFCESLTEPIELTSEP